MEAHDLAADVGQARDYEPGMEEPVGGFAELPDGRLMVGADQVLIFDGESWMRVALPGGHTVRGLAVAGPKARGGYRVYLGTIGDMGYLERIEGGWRYVSLKPRLAAAGVPTPGEIWEVASTPGGICFVGARDVVRYNPDADRVERWTLPCEPRIIPIRVEGASQTPYARQDLWLYQAGVGLLRMEAKGPECVWRDADLPGSPVEWVLPSVGGGLLVGTGDAVYARSGNAWSRLQQISRTVAGKLPSCAVALDDHTVAVGTYAGGVVIAEVRGVGSQAGPESRVLEVVDHAHGLPDDHVQALWLDSLRGLWVGMSGRVARIPAEGRSSVFGAASGLGETPVIKVAGTVGGRTVVLTTKTGYAVEGGRLEAVPGLETFVHDAASSPQCLWVAGFGGIWRLDAGSGAVFDRVYYDPQGVWSLLPVDRDRVFFAAGSILKELAASPNSGWAAHDLGAALDAIPTGMVFGPGGDIWVATRKSGIYRLEGTEAQGGDAFRLAQKARYVPGIGLPAGAYRPVLARAGRRLAAFLSFEGGGEGAGGIYELRDEKGSSSFVPATGLEGFVGICPASAAPGVSPAPYWIVRRRDLPVASVVRVSAPSAEGGTWRWDPVDVPGLERVGSVTAASFLGRTLWICGTQGLLAFEMPANPEDAPPPPSVLMADRPPDSPPGRFSFASPAAVAGAAVFYQTRLAGAERGWTAPAPKTEREFPALSPGAYRFEVRAVDRWGRSGPELAAAFAVPAPWWETWPAWAGYAACLALAGTAVWRHRVAKLTRRNAELDALVRERTRQLSERTRELEMSNTAKSEFLETISHEIRNPLNGIRGMVTMLGETALGGAQREMMASLSACAVALTRTFDEVLNFAKVEAGQVAVVRQPFDLRALVEEVVALHRVEAAQAGCAVRIRGGGPPPGAGADLRFVGDADKIRTIVSNFLGNAIKYAPGRPVEIAVEVEPEEDGGDAMVLVEVRDHGPGIPAEEQSLIFNKFVRGAGAKALRVPGTGLGLATCQALAARMDGFVGLESPSISNETGERIPGATFFLKLPLKPAGSAGQAADQASEAPEGLRPDAGAPARAAGDNRVLIVEDQDYNQKVAMRIARHLGLDPDVASDGREALAKLRAGPYGVLFLDWEMPGLKGDEIARHVRSLDWGRRAIVVATTGHDSEEIKRACLAGGMDAFVLKPYDEETMRGALAAVAPGRWNGGRPPANGDGGSRNGLKLSFFSVMGDGDPEKTRQASREFLDSLAQESAAIGRAAGRGDWAAAAGGAHRLRSLVGLVRADSLRAVAKAFQLEVGNAAPSRRAELWRQLEDEVALLRGKIGEQGQPGS
jgi:signal transduction histidine kinase/CheY-like chemotaxis protein/HPt (histidine-containing phosphotransfer) domain-containing protein